MRQSLLQRAVAQGLRAQKRKTLGPLRGLLIGAISAKRYASSIELFRAWCKRKRACRTGHAVDKRACLYVEHLWHSNKGNVEANTFLAA